MAWYSQMVQFIWGYLGQTVGHIKGLYSLLGLRMRTVLWCLVLLAIPLSASAGEHFTKFQKEKAQQAFKLAEPYGLGLTFAALVYQESSLCTHKKGIDPDGLGCTQIHKTTAQLLTNTPLSIHRLIYDDKRNMELGLAELRKCIRMYSDWYRSLMCYHYGPYYSKITPEEASSDGYVFQIKERMREITESQVLVVTSFPSK